MKRTTYSRLIMIILSVAGMGLIVSCQKSDFLNKKPNTSLIVPTTLADFQALLDNDLVIGLTPVLGEVSADNFYLTPGFWQSLGVNEHNAYIWASDIYQHQGKVQDWDLPYQQVFYANVVLEGLNKVPVDSTNALQWNTLKGAALFTRAYAFYNLAQLFAPVYDGTSAGTDPGIPLRTVSDVNISFPRASVKDTYNQILQDLQAAASLLPPTVPIAHLNRPSQPAAQALLARMYLSMRNYPAAGAHADSCLRVYSTLIDYSTTLLADTNRGIPVQSPFNTETIYQSSFFPTTVALLGLLNPEECVIDSTLYRSYSVNDLRRLIFYRATVPDSPFLKGSYAGSIYPFSGLATDEMYLVRAECAARAGNIMIAVNDLNTLLTNRYKAGTFMPYTIATTALLDTVLLERRKELAFRGLRWTDLRRLNMEGANITLTRKLGAAIYTLPPKSPLYTLPIPPDVLSLSKIPDNPRP